MIPRQVVCGLLTHVLCVLQGEESVASRRDVCVGTSVATLTDPDCLGPCEPGTSVMLEGIVWHETEGGKFC